MPPKVNEKCIACYKCVEICPCDVLREGDGKPLVAYPDECWHCGVCVDVCPVDAITFQWVLGWRLRWKSKGTGEHFRLGMATPPDPCSRPPSGGW